MAPLPPPPSLTGFLRNLDRRQNFSINVSNPLKDKTFIGTIVGIVVGAVVFLIILTLILCLYRENSPLKRCCGKRFKRATESPPPPHLKQYESGSISVMSTPEPEGSRTNLVGAAQPPPMSQVGGAGRYYQSNSSRARPPPPTQNISNLETGIGVGLKQKRRRTRTERDLSILPLSKLLPFIPTLPSTPTALLSLPPIPSPAYFSPNAVGDRDSVASGATMLTDTTVSTNGTGDFAPDARRIIFSTDSFTQYSWLLDIIHDHTAGLFRHSRLSQLGPYRLARVLEIMGAGVETDSGYCSSPARTAGTEETSMSSP